MKMHNHTQSKIINDRDFWTWFKTFSPRVYVGVFSCASASSHYTLLMWKFFAYVYDMSCKVMHVFCTNDYHARFKYKLYFFNY